MKLHRIDDSISTRFQLATILLVLFCVLGRVGAAAADGDSDEDENELVFSVFHGPVLTVLTNPYSNGHQRGDLRVASLPTEFGSGKPAGRLDATLTTTGINVPEPDDEIRISSLVFAFGAGIDQIVVNGSAVYPHAGPTLDINTTTIRPVTGGSGKFSGTTGWAESRHFTNDTWQHTFHLLMPEREERRGRRHGRRH